MKKTKEIIFLILFCLIVACNTKTFFVVQQNENGNIILIDSKKDSIIDTIKVSHKNFLPEDFKMIDENNFICFGNEYINIFNGRQNNYLINSLSEDFSAFTLMNNGIIIIDSLDFTYFDDDLIKKNEYVLLGYDTTLENKLFSISIKENNFRIKWYDDSTKYSNLKYIFYPDYFPKDPSLNDFTLTLKIININKRNVQSFDTINFSYMESELHYFNYRYVRDENLGKLSYMIMTNIPNNNEKVLITIYEWDCLLEKKSILYSFVLDKKWKTDNAKHRVYKNKLYIGYDNKIIEVSKSNEIKIIYTSNDSKILDFYVK